MQDSGVLKSSVAPAAQPAQPATLQRKIDWTGAFWVASGVPALVLFSVGAVAATNERPSWLVWMISIGFGFIQAFTYAAINTWHIRLLDLGAVKPRLFLRIDATFVIGAILMLSAFAIQHGGILRSARVTLILGVASLVPLGLIAIDPILTGDMTRSHFFPIVPLTHDAQARVIDGQWNAAGWTLMAGGLFIAAWSTYAFETSVRTARC